MAVTDMTSKERIVAAIEHRQPDRVPIMLDYAPEAKARLQQRLGLDEQGFWQWCGQDMAQVSPRYRKAVSDVHYADPMIDFVGREGGYILGGSHNIQADCPDENVMAMVDEAMRR